ncbi:MAG: DUF1573 domain-containing protein [bacterium]|nr:DUF1573 domain-containing protein [bacterium]
MRTVAIALSLISLLSSLLFAGSAIAQVIHLDNDSFDLGNMNQLESREMQVTLTNKGGGLLVISEVKADCGCTVPTLNKMQLAPGESTFMDISFNSKKFHGNITKIVHVFNNDPSTPDASIIIQANVFSPLLVDPGSRRMGFSQTSVGTSETKKVLFTATEAANLEISANKSRKGLFDISTVNNYEGNPQASALVITVPKDMPAGRQRDNVRVKTNIEGEEFVDIDLSAWPVLALRFSVDKLNFRFKKSFSTSIQVFPHEGEMEYKVTKVECDLPEIDVTFKEVTPNRQTKVIVKGAPISKTDPRAIEASGRINGTLKIHTSLKELPVMEIPVTYMIRM